MSRRAKACVAASLLAALGSSLPAGQRTAGARLTIARAALGAMNLDSASATLRDLLKSGDDVPREDRVEAWLLLGVGQFYQGGDSGTAADFREALALEPGLRSEGLWKSAGTRSVSWCPGTEQGAAEHGLTHV